MLLSGPPGVGKTLTAEAVAETMQVPLYMMAAGDLGTNPHGVLRQLDMITKMTTKWKAVLLIGKDSYWISLNRTADTWMKQTKRTSTSKLVQHTT